MSICVFKYNTKTPSYSRLIKINSGKDTMENQPTREEIKAKAEEIYPAVLRVAEVKGWGINENKTLQIQLWKGLQEMSFSAAKNTVRVFFRQEMRMRIRNTSVRAAILQRMLKRPDTVTVICI